MLPIDYRYGDPTDNHAVERIIREGKFEDWEPTTVTLGQLADKGMKRPSITEFTCLMEGGLVASFRAESFGIEAMYTTVPSDQHAKRQYGAYLVSATLGLNVVPVCAIREHPKFGTGSLTAGLFAWPFLSLQNGRSVALKGSADSVRFAEALLLNRLIGSGQHLESSLVRDRHRRVLSQYHQEAFTYTEDRRLEFAFKEAGETISPEFWEALNGSGQHYMRWARLERVLPDAIGAEVAGNFLQAYDLLVNKRKLGRCNVYLADR